MKKSVYLFLIMVLPAVAIAQTQKKTTTTTTKKTVTTTAKNPAAKPAPLPSKIEFTPFVNNENILVNGNFIISKVYEVAITTEKGQPVFSTIFTAGGAVHSFDMGKPLKNGTYKVTIHERDNPFATGTITLVKN